MKPPWMLLAEAELGVTEQPGAMHNQRIIEYHACTTLRATDDETPWCSSFVNWVMYHSGFMPTRSAAARSWLDWGIPLVNPIYGCLVILKRGSSPTAGHVTFYIGEARGGMMNCYGGNQGDSVSYANFRRSDVLGFRWPKGYIA